MRSVSLLAVLLGIGCSSSSAPTLAPPRASEATASAAPLEILPVASASAPTPAVVPPWKVGAVLQHMPARCDYGRAYFNVDELLAEGGAAALANLAAAKLPLDKDGKSMRTILAAFEKVGKNPYAAMKEVAFCFEKSNDASVAALRIDLSGLERPADLMVNAFAAGEGAPPKVETAGGFVWIEHREGKTVAVGENLILFGHTRKAAESAAADSAASDDFADAAKHVIWFRLRENDSTAKLTAIGADFEFQLDTKVGPGAASMVSSFQAMLPQLERMIDDPKLAPLKPLIPAARRASIQASGEHLQVSTRLPKTVVREVLQGFVDSPGLQLEGGL